MNTIIDVVTIRQAAELTSDPVAVVEEAMKRFASDNTALLQDDVLDALRTVRRNNEAEYERLTAKASGQKTRLDKLTRTSRDEHDDGLGDVLMRLVKQYCRFAHNADGRGVAIIGKDGIRQVWYVDSPEFADWLRALLYQEMQVGISEFSLKTVVGTLMAMGKYGGEEVEVHIRCAKYGDDYYIDLCDGDWRAIRVNARGTTIVTEPPIYFTRTKFMRPLPEPASEGDIDPLWKHVNIPENSRLELLTFILDCFRPDTPFPILELTGEQGSAKSTSQRNIRAVIDPNKVDLRGRPKTVEDIYVAGANNWVCSFENLSHLTPEQQDALCTLATGGGFATRQFFTNGDEHVLETKRPVTLNGINPIATQPDLIERTISIDAPTIPPDKRLDEQTLRAEWDEDYPVVFAGILDLFASALAKLPDVVIKHKQRMADYQRLGESVAQSMGHPAGHFSSLYANRVADGADRSLETYGVAMAVQHLLDDNKGKPWEGTVGNLKRELEYALSSDRSNWPRSPRGLAGQLKRLAPGLRRRGISVEFLGHERDGRHVRVAFTDTPASA